MCACGSCAIRGSRSIALAQSLNLEIVANGVVSAAQRDFLVAAGCYACQGFLYGEPCPAAEYERRFLALA